MKLIEFSFEIGEISFLERAKDYMPTEYLKAALGVLLLKKMTKFRKKISSSRIDYRECSFMKEWLRKK